MKLIPYGKQDIDKCDIAEVVKILKSDFITQGPAVKKFEEKLASYCGSKYAVAVSNGTAALHIACLAAGLTRSDEAITTPITFLSTANSILYTGARPVFADIDYETLNIKPEEVKKKITKKTKVILPVHFAGLPCDMREIFKIAKGGNIGVIEDGCHSLGAEYKDRGKWIKVGSCGYSDMTVFSFHPVKHITTGEGGAITTNNKKLYEKLMALRTHGVYKTSSMMKKHGLWYYEMRELGFNYRITDFQCALGLSQLKKLGKFLKKRRVIANIYNEAFKNINGVDITLVNKEKRHAYHLYILKIDFEKFKTTRRNFVLKLRREGILTQMHYIPVYRQPYYAKRYPHKVKNFPMAEKYYKKALSIPMYSAMSGKEIKKVVAVVKNLLLGT